MKATLDEPPCPVELLEGDSALRDVIDKHISEQARAQKSSFLVADLGAVVWQQVRWKAHMEQVRPFYLLKCNTSPVVVEILAALGTGFVCSTKAELDLVKSVGVPARDVVLGGACKPRSLIKHAARNGVHLLLCENDAELRKIARCHPAAKLLLQVCAAGCEHEETAVPIGCTLKDCRRLLESAKELGVNVAGVKFHICSCRAEPEAFTRAVSDARCVFDMGEEFGFVPSVLDVGGGFDGTMAQLETINRTLRPVLDAYFPPSAGVSVIAEPGAYYVSAAFSLAASVVSKTRVGRHGALRGTNEPEFEYCINDGVFGSFSCKLLEESVRPPSVHRAVRAEEPLYISGVRGNTADGLDLVLDSCLLPELSVGDWLLFHGAGANRLGVTDAPAVPVHYALSARDRYEIQDHGVTLDSAMKRFSLVPSSYGRVPNLSAVSTPA